MWQYKRYTNACVFSYAHEIGRKTHSYSGLAYKYRHAYTDILQHTYSSSRTHTLMTLIVIVVSFKVCKTIKPKSYVLLLQQLIKLLCQFYFLTQRNWLRLLTDEESWTFAFCKPTMSREQSSIEICWTRYERRCECRCGKYIRLCRIYMRVYLPRSKTFYFYCLCWHTFGPRNKSKRAVCGETGSVGVRVRASMSSRCVLGYWLVSATNNLVR